jgi:hypothetical protein
MTLKEFLSVFTVNDPVAGRALNTTTNGGVDSLGDLLTLSDPAGGRAIKIAISGGVTKFWTEAYGAGTQATSSWTPTGAATNINAAIIPKGNGAIIADIPDGTATGGNARGTYAVDLQMSRTAADQVASGSLSGILSGERNRISSSRSNTFCVIGGGQNNVISQLFGATIAGGQGNTIGDNDGWQCTIGGGSSNTITGRLASTIVGGNSNSTNNNFVTMGGRANTANGDTSTLMGGQGNTASGSHSSLIGGQGNTVGSTHDVVCGGQSNTTSGSDSSFWKFIGGGQANSITGAQTNHCGIVSGWNNTIPRGGRYSFIGGGQNNYINGLDGNYSHMSILGGSDNRTIATASAIIGGSNAETTLTGQIAHASGQFSIRGDAQAHELIWRRAITGTTTTELFLDGTAARAILPATNCIWSGIVNVSAVCTASGDGTTVVGDILATEYSVKIKRIGTNTTLVAAPQIIGTSIVSDASMSTSLFSITADDTNEALAISFTPPGTAGSTTTFRCLARFSGIQTQY